MTRTCWFSVYDGVLNFGRLHIFLPTWRKPNRPKLGRKSLCPERGGCWGWQSPTREREEPDAAEGEKIFYFLTYSCKKMHHFLFMTAVVKWNENVNVFHLLCHQKKCQMSDLWRWWFCQGGQPSWWRGSTHEISFEPQKGHMNKNEQRITRTWKAAFDDERRLV